MLLRRAKRRSNILVILAFAISSVYIFIFEDIRLYRLLLGAIPALRTRYFLFSAAAKPPSKTKNELKQLLRSGL
jgi:hypothetical protein